jgi:hypothetical protein
VTNLILSGLECEYNSGSCGLDQNTSRCLTQYLPIKGENMMNLTQKSIAYHRNGVHGESFYAIAFN